MSCRIYMDHAATTEMLPEVREAMEPYLREEYGNASTSYDMGVRMHDAIEEAREKIAWVIDAQPEEIFFTSGGSESDNWVIKSVAGGEKKFRKTSDHDQNRASCGASFLPVFREPRL